MCLLPLCFFGSWVHWCLVGGGWGVYHSLLGNLTPLSCRSVHKVCSWSTRYAVEALSLKLQLASSTCNQIKWNHFVNTHGGLRCNIPCDLHNKHVNKLFKEIRANMVAQEAPTRAAHSECMKETFDKESGVSVGTSGHSTWDGIRRVVYICATVWESVSCEGRSQHSRFPKISASQLHCPKLKQLKMLIKQEHAKHANKMKITL